jgi:hypothetical protein
MAMNKEKRSERQKIVDHCPSFFLIYGHYTVCPSPRFSLFMAIILSVLHLVFPYYGRQSIVNQLINNQSVNQ